MIFLDTEVRGKITRRIYRAETETQARSFANLFSGSAIEEGEYWMIYI